MWNKIYGCETQICTWEIVTEFEKELSYDEIEKHYRSEFKIEKKEDFPFFWKMVSFNTEKGRQHRYVLFFLKEQNDFFKKKYNRFLPKDIFLYAKADTLMRSNDGFENFRLAVAQKNALHILVFFEGRLCHWTKEVFNNEHECESYREKRLSQFDDFLKKDALFSRAKSYKKEFLRIENENESLFFKASKDSYWKGFNCNRNKKKCFAKLKYTLFFLCVNAIFFTLNIKFEKNESIYIPNVRAPHLIEPPKNDLKKEKFILPKAVVKDSIKCKPPRFKLHGIVKEKLFFALYENGESQLKQVGDSLDEYIVYSIQNDKVELLCKGKKVKILNGEFF